MEFIKNTNISSDDIHYDIIEQNIFVEDLLSNEDDIKKVQDAIDIVNKFINDIVMLGIVELR